VVKAAGEAGVDFRNWVRKWGPGLWNLLARSSESDESVLDDFYELAERARSVKATAGEAGDLARSGAFVKEWFRRAKTRTDRSALEDRVYLMGHLTLGWSSDELARILGGLSPQAFRRRLFDSLKRSADLGLEETKYLGRDCARQDLFLVDELMGLAWRDPLGFFDPEKLARHRAQCGRCRMLFERLSQEIRDVRARPVSLPPPSYLDQLERLGLFREDWKPNRWLRGWPWYVRLPLQLGLASLVVFGVLAVPYYGDLFPEWRRMLQTAARPRPVPTQKVAAVPTPVPSASFRPLVLAPLDDETTASLATAPQVVPSEAVPSQAAPTQVALMPSPTPSAAASVEPADAPKTAWNERKFYQWGAFTPNLEADTQALLAILERFKAEQAGELRLGAPNRGGRYFHFSVAFDDYSKLKDELTALGLREFSEEMAQSWRRTPMDRRRVVFLLKPKP